MEKKKYCSFKGCLTKSGEGKSLFKCPKDEVLREKWINFLKSSEKGNLKEVKSFILCEYHFNLNDLINFGTSKRLKAGSVPIYGILEVKLP